MNLPSSPQVGRLSTRTALTASGVVAVLYLAISITIVVWLTLNLTAQVDDRLQRAITIETHRVADVELTDVAEEPPPELLDGEVPEVPGAFPFGRERATWHIAVDGTVTSGRDDLDLPQQYYLVSSPQTITIEGSEIRVAGAPTEEGWVVVGESMDAVNDARTTVILGLLIIAPFLLGAVFVGSFLIGRRVAMPIEQARQRQLAFTADASHELRTPLSVIEANASLALAEERDGAWYRRAFERIVDESKRMGRLIEDMLWLARFDATERPPHEGPVDLGLLAEGAADRFARVAEARSITLRVDLETPGLTVDVPAAWIDQLSGVLLDNACKYAPTGGHVALTVEQRASRTWLVVEDDGPGIPEDQRERIFDRFHRETTETGGTGLGLAIADAIVCATDGRWQIGVSPAGGARMSVGWLASGS